MNRSILWNGFEIKKGNIETSAGKVPYIFYSPQITDQPVNIALHGEGSEKEDWLCFNSAQKLGNLLKESIRKNSPFIAFDLYGHGEWIPQGQQPNIVNLSQQEREELIEISIKGIQEALPVILKEEDLETNPITITAFSIGCSVALGLKTPKTPSKTALLSPYMTENRSECENFFVFRGKKDSLVSKDEFGKLKSTLPKSTVIHICNCNHEVPESWINKVKPFIYS